MPRKKSRIFTDVELEFMRIIWELGEPTPDEIGEALEIKGRGISVGSIRNILSIMIKKGYLVRRKEGKAYRYKGKVHKEQVRKTIIADLLVNAFNGSESLIVAALLDNKEISQEEREKIRLLLGHQERSDTP
ncbi:MAG: BlaI/MecI/CopY family transcriptional regulator [Candidatus Latescibacterota bacterium]